MVWCIAKANISMAEDKGKKEDTWEMIHSICIWYTIILNHIAIIEPFTSLLTFWLLKLSLCEGEVEQFMSTKSVCVLCAEWAIHHWASLDEVRALIWASWWGPRPIHDWFESSKKGGGFQCPVSQCLASKEREETEFNSSVNCTGLVKVEQEREVRFKSGGKLFKHLIPLPFLLNTYLLLPDSFWYPDIRRITQYDPKGQPFT